MKNHQFLDPVRPGDPTVESVEISTNQFEAILNIQQKILNFIAQDREENDILDKLCELSESIIDNAVASIMLLNPKTNLLSIISAPSIPEEGQQRLCNITPGIGNGSCAAAVFHAKPAYINDTSTDRRWKNACDFAFDFNICSCWSMPVYNRNGRVVGSFALSSFEHRTPSTFHDRLLKMCSSVVSILLERKELRRLSLTDKLTNLWNREKLDQVLHTQRDSYSIYTETYAVMIIDIDHFKMINDTYGHNVGDTVIVDTAILLQNNVRPRDLVGRWGGEEYMIILPNAGDGMAKKVAEDIRIAIKNHHFGPAGSMTVSIGICEVNENLRALEIIDRADRALYEAKASGRDRVCMFHKNKPTWDTDNIIDLNKRR